MQIIELLSETVDTKQTPQFIVFSRGQPVTKSFASKDNILSELTNAPDDSKPLTQFGSVGTKRAADLAAQEKERQDQEQRDAVKANFQSSIQAGQNYQAGASQAGQTTSAAPAGQPSQAEPTSQPTTAAKPSGWEKVKQIGRGAVQAASGATNLATRAATGIGNIGAATAGAVAKPLGAFVGGLKGGYDVAKSGGTFGQQPATGSAAPSTSGGAAQVSDQEFKNLLAKVDQLEKKLGALSGQGA